MRLRQLRSLHTASFFLVLACSALAVARAPGADWPQWLGPERDGVWRETGLIERFPASGPKVLWRAPLGTGYSGPAVAGERVYVMDREQAKGPDGKPSPAARDGIPGKERVVCLSAADGKRLWTHEYDCRYRVSYPSGPRVTPLVHQGRVYTLGAMGDLCCLDAATGVPRWTKNLPAEYHAKVPAWGYAAHPLLDGRLLYTLVGGKGSCVVALDKDTGKEVWKALTTEEIGYSPPVLCTAGGKRQLLVWNSDSLNGLDPATGKLDWTQPYPTSGRPHRPTVNVATVRCQGDRVFLSSAFHGPVMLKLAADKPAVSVVWQTDPRGAARGVLNILCPSPVLKDGCVYGVAFTGELMCLDAQNGKVLWRTYAAVGGEAVDCGTAFLIPQGDRFVIYNDTGDLILARLTPKGYHEISRAHVLAPNHAARGRNVVWSHPAFAHRCVFARNDKEMVCVSLADPSAAG
jgi:outer membrane protein assembly factor BamB